MNFIEITNSTDPEIRDKDDLRTIPNKVANNKAIHEAHFIKSVLLLTIIFFIF